MGQDDVAAEVETDRPFEAEVAPLLLLPPTVGVRFIPGRPVRYLVAVPLTVQFGAKLDSKGGRPMRALQAALEASLVFGGGSSPDLTLGWGLRYRWRGLSWIRPAVGAWVSLTPTEQGSLLSHVGPEGTLYFGACCQPGSISVAARALFDSNFEPTYTLQGGVSFF